MARFQEAAYAHVKHVIDLEVMIGLGGSGAWAGLTGAQVLQQSALFFVFLGLTGLRPCKSRLLMDSVWEILGTGFRTKCNSVQAVQWWPVGRMRRRWK